MCSGRVVDDWTVTLGLTVVRRPVTSLPPLPAPSSRPQRRQDLEPRKRRGVGTGDRETEVSEQLTGDIRTYLEAIHALNAAVLSEVAFDKAYPIQGWLDALEDGTLPQPSADEVWSILLRWWDSEQRAHVLADWAMTGALSPETLRSPVHGGIEPLILDTWSDLKFGGGPTSTSGFACSRPSGLCPTEHRRR